MSRLNKTKKKTKPTNQANGKRREPEGIIKETPPPLPPTLISLSTTEPLLPPPTPHTNLTPLTPTPLNTLLHQPRQESIQLTTQTHRRLGLLNPQTIHKRVISCDRHHARGIVDHEQQVADLGAVVEVGAQAGVGPGGKGGAVGRRVRGRDGVRGVDVEGRGGGAGGLWDGGEVV